MLTPREILRQYWHYDDFRPLQAEIIASVLEGRDTLALMPTGGGKSLCFQVPTMVMDGLCLVITPLIALMKDQVQNLRDRDIFAECIYTGLSNTRINETLDKCRYGNRKFLYVSPERLQSAEFVKQIITLDICLIAVDEAHCISQWGYDFRPAYLQIADIRKALPKAPVLALTATATPQVVDDIQERLNFKEKNVLKKSFARDNLTYVVRTTEDKYGQMLHILNNVQGSSIIYTRNRKKTAETADYLIKNGITATNYHAGLPTKEKDIRQKDWREGKTRVMVATNAFGMGIDKPDVRTVIHLDLPDSLEAYFQEAGRAGRDGERAYAILLYNKGDDTKLKKRVSDNYPQPDFIKRVYEAIGDWFEVGIGSGYNHTFAFPLEKMCIAKGLPIIQTFSAVQILQQAGYLTYIEETEINPRVMMLITKEELYRTKISNVADRIINCLFRNYTGIFADPVYINENFVSQQTGLSTETIHETLISLSMEHVIRYIPRIRTPYIHYPLERQALKFISLPKHIYIDRQKQYVERLQSMLDYASQVQFCRSQLLLSYFGENDAPACNQCDVCRRRILLANR